MNKKFITEYTSKKEIIKRRIIGIVVICLCLCIIAILISQLIDKISHFVSAVEKKHIPQRLSREDGLVAEGRHEWQRAIQIYTDLLTKNPNQAELWKRIADIDNHLKKHAEAVLALKNAINLQPRNAAWHAALSETYQTLKQANLALPSIQEAVFYDPNNIAYLFQQARIAAEVDNLILALKSYEQILYIQPDNTEALLCKKELETRINLVKDKNSNIDNQKLTLHPAEQLQVYKESFYDNPNQPEPWKKIAALYAELSNNYRAMRNFDDALIAAQTAVLLEPNNPEYVRRRMQNANDAGIIAEEKKEWHKAMAIYEVELARTREQPNLWQRLGYIQNYFQLYTKAIEAFKEAIKYQLKDASLYAALADTYAANKQYEEAYETINKGLELEPNKVSLLASKAAYATELKDFITAENTYNHILCLEINHKDAQLGLIHILNKKEQLTAALIAYQDFISQFPNEKSVWLEYAEVSSWVGDTANALRILESYRKQFGETDEYWTKKAKLLATSGHPREALCIIDKLLEKKPNDYNLIYTQTIALNANNEFSRSITNLDFLTQKYPSEHKDILKLSNNIKIPLKHNLNLNPFNYHDTTKINVTGLQIFGEYFMTPELSLQYGMKRETLRAPTESGLETFEGYSSVWDRSEWLGMRGWLTPECKLGALGGIGHIQRRKSYFLYDISMLMNLDDIFTIDFQKGKTLYSNIRDQSNGRVLYAISPRSVSLGILQNYNRISITLHPNQRSYLEFNAEYDTFSDSNTLRLFNLAPYFTAINAQYFNLNLGFCSTLYGFSKRLNDGYYSPLAYQLYQATTTLVIKANENVNFILFAAAGQQRDETMPQFDFAGDLSLKAIFGMFSDWQLSLSANGLARKSIHLLYKQYTFEGLLTKRF